MSHMPAGVPFNAYDELPYRSHPVEWTAPERLALTSLLHGGPRAPLRDYRVLELGCGNGANLLPLAHYRTRGSFVGVDGAAGPIDVARQRASALALSNVEFIRADFVGVDRQLDGQFDYIVAHGVFSWVADEVRDALLAVCRSRLRDGGLLYLNYNTRPGWNVRGLVREFLLAQMATTAGLRARAEGAVAVAQQMAAALTDVTHPYSQLLAREFSFVAEGDVTWVAHEFLSPHNRAYWRSDALALLRSHGLEYVADADFNQVSGRVPAELVPRLGVEHITGRSIDDTVDLLTYRQLHSPIVSTAPRVKCPPLGAEFGALFVASCLEPSLVCGDAPSVFRHPLGLEVEVRDEAMHQALARLFPLWPRGIRAEQLFPDVGAEVEDLALLHRHGLIELRCIEPGDFGISETPLNELERSWGGYRTDPYHQIHRVEQ